uniref:Relaxin-3 n=3 Tax=Clupeocephala TaxID=186625 RepID=A0A3B4D4N6_PYGNA
MRYHILKMSCSLNLTWLSTPKPLPACNSQRFSPLRHVHRYPYTSAVLAVCLLMAGVRAMDGPTYGVKLCGREFIRAVIFTCGGSRWRRSITSTDDLTLDPFSTEDRDAADGWVLPSDPEVSIQQAAEAASLGLTRSGQEGAMFSRPARSLISEEVLEALRTSSRKGRDVVVGLSNACCKWGCSKSEISSLC